MIERHSLITSFYDRLILRRPKVVILCLVLVVSFLGYKARHFELDASAETLILETDEDLLYSRLIEARYGSDDYLVVTFTPQKDLFSEKTLETLTRLRNELRQLDTVSSVVSILDVPLLESGSLSVKELVTHDLTLESVTSDRQRAMVEFADSPLYQNLIVSADLKTTALQIKFHHDTAHEALAGRFQELQNRQAQGALGLDEQAELERVARELKTHREEAKKTRHRDIATIRSIMEKYRHEGKLFLGGVSMIADDMISFIKSDLKMFGLGVMLFLAITLSAIFRSMRWVILPILCCALSAISMMGLLGMFGWHVTVISSNFISLQLILTMSLTIHLIVRYREVAARNLVKDQKNLVFETVRTIFTPCFYATLTTIVGFGSLVFCDILPVRTFGWMMNGGLLLSLALTFLLFPAGLMLLTRRIPAIRRSRFSLTPFLAEFTEAHGILILVMSLTAFVISLVGIEKLEVENSFINYFREKTEISQGMKVIDQKLGGTTPLEVIVQVDESKHAPSAGGGAGVPLDEEFKKFDEFDKAVESEKYWFTSEKMALAVRIHDYLDSLPETGKVLSLGTIIKIGEKLNFGRPFEGVELAMLHTKLPDKLKNTLLKPYVSTEHGELRFVVRVRDSEKTLRRNALLEKIRHDLSNKLGLGKEQVHLTGLLVLYNNMLQSLFSSQILTLGIVAVALAGMFLVIFHSVKVALIAIAPSLLAISAVLGIMGWLNIPLDMMTITIAAITIGIGVDDTIHYVYRFRREIYVDRSYVQAMHRCHRSIGDAMTYTSVTIIIGLSVLVASSFIPTILFGLFTALAMSIALIANLTLLPQLLIALKPFSFGAKERSAAMGEQKSNRWENAL
jgi:predicted RND superfamily exporter protein